MFSSSCPIEDQGRGKLLFLTAFVSSCVLFWWLPSIVYRFLVHLPDPVENTTILTSVLALALFTAGYTLPVRKHTQGLFPDSLLDSCERFTYAGTIILAFPSLAMALQFWHARSGVDYGSGTNISGVYQAVLYTHIFLGLLNLGLADPQKTRWRRLIIVCSLITLPRLIISLHWGRFFLAQAVVPIVLIAIARGWVRLSAKRVVQLAILGASLILVPAITRGDNLVGGQEFVQFLASGSTLRLYQDHIDLNLNGRCPPMLVSFTAKVIPYRALGICVIDLWGMKGLPATLDRLLASEEPGSEVQLVGPGSNFLLELSLTGGSLALLAGCILFGRCCRQFIAAIGRRSLFAGIWAECLTRALLTPRSNLGYVFERIPTLIVATFFVVVIVTAWQALLAVDSDAEPGPALSSEGTQ